MLLEVIQEHMFLTHFVDEVIVDLLAPEVLLPDSRF